MKFEVLIIGTDANAYYMSRCFHEAYGKKAYILGNKPLPFTTYSNIANITYNDKIWDEKEFIKALNNFKRILDSGNWVRRVFVRKLTSPYGEQFDRFAKDKLDEFKNWSSTIENDFTIPMLKQVFPVGLIIKE